LLTALGCLSSAVMYLHTSKVKHKDIKPENILVDKNGSVILADFGISKQYNDETATEGPTPFTNKYASPEVVGQNKRDLDSDVFSLGCVFLEIVTIILGKSLGELKDVVFAKKDRQSYQSSLSEVSSWINQLEKIARSGAYSIRSDGVKSSELLTPQHLDTIRCMMSKTPANRPSIAAVYQLFKSFSAQCPECHGVSLSSGSKPLLPFKEIALPIAWREESRDNNYNHYSNAGSMGAQSRTNADETEDDYSSDTESLYSVSNTEEDLETQPDTELEPYIFILETLIQRCSEQNNEHIFPALEKIRGFIEGFCYRPAEGGSGSRQQGSSANAPSHQRGSAQQRETFQRSDRPDRSGGGESDGDQEYNQRRGRNNGRNFSASSRSKMFACPYSQRERLRNGRERPRSTNRACHGPGWPGIYRLK